jgi:PKD domain/Secretion system C-terminal sorting domain
MRSHILYFCLFLNISLCISQKHDYNWINGFKSNNSQYSGSNIISFESYPPEVSNGQLFSTMLPQAITMSDSLGNLAFYSNGIRIYGKNNQLMSGGQWLNPGVISTNYEASGGYPLLNGTIVLPINGSNKYAIFNENIKLSTQGLVFIIDTLYFAIIDMDENNGNGKLVKKKIPVIGGDFGLLNTTKHANGKDWWIIVPSRIVPEYHRILLRGDTFIVYPSQNIGFQLDYGQTENDINLFSPDGKKYAHNNFEHGISLFDFDRCTGLLSNPQWLPSTEYFQGYGADFSPNSRFLYINGWAAANNRTTKLMQFDTWQPDFTQNIDTISILPTIQSVGWDTVVDYSVMKTAPDGRIYIHGGYHKSGDIVKWFYHIIPFPNRKGKDCGFLDSENGMVFKKQRISLDLPNYPNYRLGPIDGSTCDSLGLDNHPLSNWRWDIEDSTNIRQVTFTDNASYEPTTWHWDFGDGTMSQDTSPVHTYTQNGVYYVCLTVCNTNSCDTLCRDVYIGVSGIEETAIAQPKELIAYPNPAADILYLKLQSNQQSQVQITDLTGKIVLQQEINQQSGTTLQEINIAHLPIGMYVLSVRYVHGLLGVAKLVVLRE